MGGRMEGGRTRGNAGVANGGEGARTSQPTAGEGEREKEGEREGTRPRTRG